MIIIKSERELDKMRAAGRLAAQALQRIVAQARPGTTTEELDAAAEQCIRDAGGVPSFKGYRGFPATVCASMDSEVVHGIPGPRRLEEGSILSVDVGAILGGFHGDNATSIGIGSVSAEVSDLLRAGEAALRAGIEQAKPGNRLSDISHAVQTCAHNHNYSVVRDYAGHGIGRQMHEDPSIPNYGPPGRGPELKPGMVLAIEPMLNQGDYRVKTSDDGWTVRTADGGLSVHFEHTVAVTEAGPEVLTEPPKGPE